MAENFKDQIRSANQGAPDAAKGLVDTATTKAREAADTVSDMASHAKERIQDWASGAAQRFETTKDTVEDWGAQALGSTEACMKSTNEQIVGLIRTHPIPSLLVGFGIGFLLAQLTTERR